MGCSHSVSLKGLRVSISIDLVLRRFVMARAESSCKHSDAAMQQQTTVSFRS